MTPSQTPHDEPRNNQSPELHEEENKSGFVIVYSAMAFSGFIMGFICGWLAHAL